mmetsp:Transcript_12112/g.17863  ORF Transcript_12112/g.17863 Transcript_12112/m.17863 type:complete len:155 (-) Transcript_12112:365-829(-)
MLYCVAVIVSHSTGAQGGGSAAAWWLPSRDPLRWIDFLYFLSYVKLAISVLKYMPQVFLNMQRRSTAGWNIWNVLLDFFGGCLSVLQLLLDCWNTDDWTGISGDPVKFGLGFASMFFDVIFMVQHYVLYPKPEHARSDNGSVSSCGGEEVSMIQ